MPLSKHPATSASPRTRTNDLEEDLNSNEYSKVPASIVFEESVNALDDTVPVAWATVMVSALCVPCVVSPAIPKVVVPVTFPVTEMVSAVPFEKLTSIFIVPPPVRLPPIVNESSMASSCKVIVPANANSPVANVCPPRNEAVALDCMDTFSQLVRFVDVRANVPEANCNSSTDCVLPESVPPSSVAAEVKVPPDIVNTSLPAPN